MSLFHHVGLSVTTYEQPHAAVSSHGRATKSASSWFCAAAQSRQHSFLSSPSFHPRCACCAEESEAREKVAECALSLPDLLVHLHFLSSTCRYIPLLDVARPRFYSLILLLDSLSLFLFLSSSSFFVIHTPSIQFVLKGLIGFLSCRETLLPSLWWFSSVFTLASKNGLTRRKPHLPQPRHNN